MTPRTRLSDPRLRRVERVHMRLPAGASAHAARHALEDALATADFCDCGRLIVMRRLALKARAGTVCGPSLARALERAWRDAAAGAVRADAASAEGADTVYFDSAAAARLEWLGCVAHARPVHAWFWPRAVPEAARAAASADVVLAVANEVARQAPREFARWLVDLAPTMLLRLLHAMPASIPATQLRAPHTTAGDLRASSPPTPVPVVFVPQPQPVPAVRCAMEGLGADDWRVVWLQHRLMPVDGPRPPGKPSSAASWPRSSRGDAEVADPESPAPSSGAKRAWLPATVPEPSGRTPHAPATCQQQRPGMPWLRDAEATEWGGLPMLLNPLLALGFSGWLDRQSPLLQDGFSAALWLHVCDRLRVPSKDPVRGACGRGAQEAAALSTASVAWDGFCWPGWLTFAPTAEDNTGMAAVEVWLRALRRALRRHAGIGVASLAHRPALLAMTPTHIDVVLPLGAADLRARRAGLDLDPGWVPWFGRIVAFHYIEGPHDAR